MATKKFKTNSQALETSEDSLEVSEDFNDVLEEIKETSEELREVIVDYLDNDIESISSEEQGLIDLNIPYCKKCKLQFTVDLWGNPQCEKQLIDCPTIKK
jgi:transcription termination factor NusB